VGRISLADLAAVYAGEITSWAALGGEDLPIRPHLGPEDSALAQAFVAEVLDAAGVELSSQVIRDADGAAVAAAVAGDPQALGVLPFEGFGQAQPLALVGECGLPFVPRATAVRAGDYPLTVPLSVLQPMRRLAPAAQGFVDFLATPEAQLVLRRAGNDGHRRGADPLGRAGRAAGQRDPRRGTRDPAARAPAAGPGARAVHAAVHDLPVRGRHAARRAVAGAGAAARARGGRGGATPGGR
jgi:phosphate transport system substrate-binding protein